MENGMNGNQEAQERAKCLSWFTDIANRAYENILHPAEAMERLENENEGKKGRKIQRLDFDLDNNFGQRIISCTQHHYNCINLYRKYFEKHSECIAISDEVTARADKLITANRQKEMTHLALRHLKALLDQFQTWRDKLDELVDTSLTVPPIKKRTSHVVSKTQVEAIYSIDEEENYHLQITLEPGKRMNELEAAEGEKFVLLDNTNKMFWTVKNRHGVTGELPSLFLTNCAPDATLIRKSSRLEDEFSAVVKQVVHLLESAPPTLPQIKDLKREYAYMLHSAARRNMDAKPMPRSPIMSRAQSRESLDSKTVDAKIIEYTTTITETTIVEDITCYAPEYSEYMGQEVQMFLIAGVIDTRNNREISIDDAKDYGIVEMEEGVYNNLATGETMPISEAMNQGLIIVEKSVTRKQKEKETKRRARSYEDLLG